MSLEAYHRSRSLEHQPFRAACYAPSVALSFDVYGTVSVCAFTRATPLGHVGDASLEELWRGPAARAIRAAVRQDDLTAFCSRCAEEIDGGNVHGVLARGFDQFTAEDPPSWPTRMEFALTNACNLQCVMCSGEYSSSIRARREGLPPLPDRYGDGFLDELEPFLPHLRQARFLGGEPFLGEVNFRIWERMIAIGARAECNVTTNGTVWTPRVEAVMEALPFSVGISIDGVRRETVETIRAGASHERLMANLDKFLAYRDRHGTSLSLTYCLMRENWQELADFLRFADDRDCDVYVNTVRQPPRHSLYHLPLDDLRKVVAELDAQHDTVIASLERNRDVWIEQTGRLRAHLDAGGTDPTTVWEGLAKALIAAPSAAATHDLLQSAAVDHEVSALQFDDDERLVGGDRYLGIDVRPLLGKAADHLRHLLAEQFGHRADVLAEEIQPGALVRVVSFGEPGGQPTVMASVTSRTPGSPGSTRVAAVLRSGRRADQS